MNTEWEITFDGKNTRAIQALVGRMQNRDGDVDQVRFFKSRDRGYIVWIEDLPNPRPHAGWTGGWVPVEEGDTISKIRSMWVPKYGDSPVFRVTKGEVNE